MTIILTVTALMVSVSACGQGKPGAAKASAEAAGRFWVTTPADSLLAETVLADLKDNLAETKARGQVTIAELMVRAGKAMEGQPYVAGTLDESPEQLRIYLTRTDCIIFVETCLALARTTREDGDFQTFANELRQSRYREGRIEAYADRLHYTTEWARQGEARGVLKDVTRTLGGEPLARPINYMSAHPESYPLMDDPAAIRAVEDRINSEPRYYIPKSKLAGALDGIRSGDIICLVSAVEGLDIAHVGLALVVNGRVKLFHASTSTMKVTEDSRTLQEYLAGRSSILGIQVLRPLN
jgi:hypothetical protein